MSPTLRYALLGAALFSAQAAAVEFSYVTGNPAPEAFGNSYAQTQNGLTATATAWSTTGSGGRYQSAELEIYSGYGMGVCNRSEGINCSNANNMHALDNAGGATDLILFRFSTPVQFSHLTLQEFGRDSDLSLWAGTGPLQLDNLKPNNLGHATLGTITSQVKDIKTVDLTGLAGTYDWLAVSARLAQSNDFAKLRTLYVEAVTSPVPEADTSALFLAGLGLTGLAARRRNKLPSAAA